MNDELLCNNYLMVLKSTIEVYIHGTLESSNEKVRNLLKEGLDETLTHQYKLYNKMVENEWYVVDNINPDNILKVLNSFDK